MKKSTLFPTRHFYTRVTSLLLENHPQLRDVVGSGADSWKDLSVPATPCIVFTGQEIEEADFLYLEVDREKLFRVKNAEEGLAAVLSAYWLFNVQRKKLLWLKLADLVNSEFGGTLRGLQIENKWKSLERAYKRAKAKNNTSGDHRVPCEFEDELAKVLEKEHHIPPTVLLETGVAAGSSDLIGGDCLLCGDFNAAHPRWGSRRADRRGRDLTAALRGTSLHILNSGVPTFVRRGGVRSCIDLSIVSQRPKPGRRADGRIYKVTHWDRFRDLLGSLPLQGDLLAHVA
ncbi:hypothetical protein V5799_017696, partial [Amblyomma americanum]